MQAISLDQPNIQTLAPDAASFKAAQSLLKLQNWQQLSSNETAIWGQCKGSAVYQVSVDRRDWGAKCSCPSRKFPCKHSLALLLLAHKMPEQFAENGTPPDSVQSWLDKRGTVKPPKVDVAAEPSAAEAQDKSKQKRQAAREKKISDGIGILRRFMMDLMNLGLAQASSLGFQAWDTMSARMVDAQASGLAGRVREMATLAAQGRDSIPQLAHRLGQMQLLLDAYERQATLPSLLCQEVRAYIGWNMKEEELMQISPAIEDNWFVLLQYQRELDDLLLRKTYIIGKHSQKLRYILEFKPLNSSYGEWKYFPDLTFIDGALYEYPSLLPQRAALPNFSHDGLLNEIFDHNYGELFKNNIYITWQAVFEDYGKSLALNPWLYEKLYILENFKLVLDRQIDESENITKENTKITWYLMDNQQNIILVNAQENADENFLWTLYYLSQQYQYQTEHKIYTMIEWDGVQIVIKKYLATSLSINQA